MTIQREKWDSCCCIKKFNSWKQSVLGLFENDVNDFFFCSPKALNLLMVENYNPDSKYHVVLKSMELFACMVINYNYR